jgi:hypothetical protein
MGDSGCLLRPESACRTIAQIGDLGPLSESTSTKILINQKLGDITFFITEIVQIYRVDWRERR